MKYNWNQYSCKIIMENKQYAVKFDIKYKVHSSLPIFLVLILPEWNNTNVIYD